MSIHAWFVWFALFFIFVIMLAFSLMEFAKHTVNPVSKKISLMIFFISNAGIMVLVGIIVYQFFSIYLIVS